MTQRQSAARRLGLSAAVLLMLAACNQGAVSPQGRAVLQSFEQANASLQQALSQAEMSGGQPPRLTDPVSAATINAAFNPEAFRAADHSDMMKVQAVCDTALKSMLGYMNLGSSRVVADPTALMSQNSITYQDELFRGMTFAVGCMAETLPLTDALLASTAPADRNAQMTGGAAQVKAGVAQTLGGVVQSAIDAGIRPENLDLVLNEAVRVAPVMAAALAPTQRQTLITQIDAVAPNTSPAVAGKLASLRAALTTAGCGALCSA